jgi:hypothetical protein
VFDVLFENLHLDPESQLLPFDLHDVRYSGVDLLVFLQGFLDVEFGFLVTSG